MIRSPFFLGIALLGLYIAPAQAVSVYVSCLAGHDGTNGTSAIQIRRVRDDASFTIKRVRIWDENGGLVADRSGALLQAVLTVAPQPFAGTTLTTTSVLGATNAGRILVRFEITDTRTKLSDNAPFLIQSIVNTTTPPSRMNSYCDNGGFNG